MGNRDALRLPVVSLGAEHLVIGHLMRRNILAYKAPPNNEGYDLICIHPNPKQSTKAVRVQVKSRYQTDCDRSFPVKEKTFGAFDYLIVVFMNIGYFYRKTGGEGGDQLDGTPSRAARNRLEREVADAFPMRQIRTLLRRRRVHHLVP